MGAVAVRIGLAAALVAAVALARVGATTDTAYSDGTEDLGSPAAEVALVHRPGPCAVGAERESRVRYAQHDGKWKMVELGADGRPGGVRMYDGSAMYSQGPDTGGIAKQERDGEAIIVPAPPLDTLFMPAMGREIRRTFRHAGATTIAGRDVDLYETSTEESVPEGCAPNGSDRAAVLTTWGFDADSGLPLLYRKSLAGSASIRIDEWQAESVSDAPASTEFELGDGFWPAP